MAATAVASSFSTPMQSFKCISSKSWPNSDHLLKISSAKTFQPASLSHSLGIEFNPFSNNKWRVSRILAAVAQEEAAVTASVEEPPAETAEVSSDGGVGDAENGGVNTKLYFGNLPYHCDSAQLAGIIQEYASPELVEVLYDRNTGRSRGFAFVTMSSIEECNTVIQNLDGSILTQAFQEYGNVVGARVLYDGETGRSRGYGFVSYETKAEMETALQALNGELEGRAMRVSLAEGKKQ
ncbi:hypothetical protein DH2020_027489 [Rehmannia glutinosa]|uniref:RRM domain-containing protein n=1 Tax=Rehmannia glutinosa TaxID=99300 RepID=A0ABR0VU12_REHGL